MKLRPVLLVLLILLGFYWLTTRWLPSGALAGLVYLHKGAYGESCARPDDCRSGLCIKSTGFILGKGGFTEKWCSQKCLVDADCAGGSTCIELELDDASGVPTGKTIRACGHK